MSDRRIILEVQFTDEGRVGEVVLNGKDVEGLKTLVIEMTTANAEHQTGVHQLQAWENGAESLVSGAFA